MTRGEKKSTRRRILNWLIRQDDLRDLDDDDYAGQWGEPKSSKRLEKMANTLATFIRNAKLQTGQKMDAAIEEWSEDLGYLKTTFYDDWGGFPWPDVEY